MSASEVAMRDASVLAASRTDLWYSSNCVKRWRVLRLDKSIFDHCRILTITSVLNTPSATRSFRTQQCPASHLLSRISCSILVTSWSKCLFTWKQWQNLQFPPSTKSKDSLHLSQGRAVCSYIKWQQPSLPPHRSLKAYCVTLWWRWLVFFSFLKVMEHRWNETDREKSKYSEKKPVPVPLCPPQIPHRLTRDRIRASAMGGRRLTAWAMARPSLAPYTSFLVVPKHKIYVLSPSGLLAKYFVAYFFNFSHVSVLPAPSTSLSN
jgi:hypothetical protein